MLYRLILAVAFLASLLISYAVNQIRKKNPNIINHLIKLLFDAISIISGALIASLFLKADEQQVGMIMTLILVIICLEIIIEMINEPIKRNKIVLGLLLIFPIGSAVYATDQFQSMSVTKEKDTAKAEAKEDYVKTTQDRNLSLRQQENNNISLSEDATNNYEDRILVSGKTTPGIYVYGENPTDKTAAFMVKASNTGRFSVMIPKDKLKKTVKLELYVNHISLLNDNTIKREASSSPDKVLNIANLPTKKIYKGDNYQVGKDIGAGEYILLSDGTGQVEWSSGNSKSFDKSMYVTLSNGDDVNVSNATIIMVPKNTGFMSNEIDNGMLKVGNDIAPGRYQVKSTSKYSTAKVYKKPISNKLDEGKNIISKEIDLKSSQYVYLMNTQLIKK